MTVTNVDVVFVIDTSDSMGPCIGQLRQHLGAFFQPLQGFSYKVSFGLVGLKVMRGVETGASFYSQSYMQGSDFGALYAQATHDEFFTQDSAQVLKRLNELETGGDEDNLLALDLALDHPFGPVATTKRVVALFSDEPLETGINGSSTLHFIPKIIDKIHARRIKLFCAMPYSDAAQALSEANGSEIEDVVNGDGLASVDFNVLLAQMGKSISVSSLQSTSEAHYEPALFGQDKWTTANESVDTRDQN